MPEWPDELGDPEQYFEDNLEANGGGAQGANHQNRALALTFFDELAETPPKPWLIKNVIARGETSSWIAPPGKGKSALLTDIAHASEITQKPIPVSGRIAIFAGIKPSLTRLNPVAERVDGSLVSNGRG